MADIKTQADLEGMLNDPQAFDRYVTEKSLEVIGTSVKEQMDEAFKDNNPVSRPPLSEEAIVEGQTLQGKQFGGGWQGGDDTKINLAREAKIMDGQFKSFGEFLTAIAPMSVSRGVDSRLKVLGEGQGDQGGFLVPEQFTTQLLALSLEDSVIRPRAFRLPMSSLNLSLPTIVDTTHATNVFGGVRGYWTPESGSYTASEPSFGRVQLTAKKLTAYTSQIQQSASKHYCSDCSHKHLLILKMTASLMALVVVSQLVSSMQTH